MLRCFTWGNKNLWINAICYYNIFFTLSLLKSSVHMNSIIWIHYCIKIRDYNPQKCLLTANNCIATLNYVCRNNCFTFIISLSDCVAKPGWWFCSMSFSNLTLLYTMSSSCIRFDTFSVLSASCTIQAYKTIVFLQRTFLKPHFTCRHTANKNNTNKHMSGSKMNTLVPRFIKHLAVNAYYITVVYQWPNCTTQHSSSQIIAV